jgi:hypothetical protein
MKHGGTTKRYALVLELNSRAFFVARKGKIRKEGNTHEETRISGSGWRSDLRSAGWLRRQQ